jgi:hypothetical protein
MNVEVAISPTQQGHIVVHEGDDPNILARNFCRIHKLNKQMESNLVKHLIKHIKNYQVALKMRSNQT